MIPINRTITYLCQKLCSFIIWHVKPPVQEQTCYTVILFEFEYVDLIHLLLLPLRIFILSMCETGFLVSGISDWEDSISSCHVVSQSVSFQVQPVQEMSGQGNYHYSSIFTVRLEQAYLPVTILMRFWCRQYKDQKIPNKILFIWIWVKPIKKLMLLKIMAVWISDSKFWYVSYTSTWQLWIPFYTKCNWFT